MTKKEFVELLSEKTICSKRETEDFLNALVEIIVEKLNETETCRVPGIGIFNKRMRSERTCLNPRTKETLNVPAKPTVHLKVSRQIKKSMI